MKVKSDGKAAPKIKHKIAVAMQLRYPKRQMICGTD